MPVWPPHPTLSIEQKNLAWLKNESVLIPLYLKSATVPGSEPQRSAGPYGGILLNTLIIPHVVNDTVERSQALAKIDLHRDAAKSCLQTRLNAPLQVADGAPQNIV